MSLLSCQKRSIFQTGIYPLTSQTQASWGADMSCLYEPHKIEKVGYHSKSCLVTCDCYFIRLAVTREGQNERFKSGTAFLYGTIVKKAFKNENDKRDSVDYLNVQSSQVQINCSTTSFCVFTVRVSKHVNRKQIILAIVYQFVGATAREVNITSIEGFHMWAPWEADVWFIHCTAGY